MKIGKNIQNKEPVTIDLHRLIATRMLIQANSGGGKSWLIRKILEESHGKVQQIVIDLEGEFSTLREKFDYLLVGRDGEIPATIRTAELLSKKLLELNVSSIIDLSELKHHERIIFVKRFLDALVDAPKNLWHPCLVIIDEAHQFCPQASKSDSASSVIDLMTRGRKRGFCGILATQRISKLHKDACAEANNRLIGRTGLDVDRKRASEELGFTSKEDERSLRQMEAGHFYGFGPAISKEIIKIKIGNVMTTHPEPGKIVEPVQTPKNIQKILKNVIDLPKEAEEEAKTKEDLKRSVTELKRHIRVLEHNKASPIVDEKSIEIAKNQAFKQAEISFRKESQSLQKTINIQNKKFQDIATVLGKNITLPKPEIPQIINVVEKQESKPIPNPERNIRKVIPRIGLTDIGPLRKGAMQILGWLCGSYPNPLSKQRIATLSGFSAKGGTFNTYLSELKRNGWVTGNDSLTATEDGLKQVTNPPEIPSGEELLNLWASKFRVGAAKLLRIIHSHYPGYIGKDELGLESGFEPRGGTFNTYISELRRNGLIKIEGNEIKVTEEFF